MQVSNDLDFKKYVDEYCDVDSHDADEDDSSYFSDDDIPSNKNEEVDDDYFNMHLMDSTVPDEKAKTITDRPQDTLKLAPDTPVTVSNIIAQPNDKFVDLTNSQTAVILFDDGAPTTAKANTNSEHEKVVDIFGMSPG
jgi:hypothetical protein